MKQLTRPRVMFIGAAFISFLFSVSLWFLGYREQAIFVGIWVPSILALGAFLFVSDPTARRMKEGS